MRSVFRGAPEATCPEGYKACQLDDYPAAFNFMPWREIRQARWRRRQRRCLLVGSVIAVCLPVISGYLLYQPRLLQARTAYESEQQVLTRSTQRFCEVSTQRRTFAAWLKETEIAYWSETRGLALARLLNTIETDTFTALTHVELADGRLTVAGHTHEITRLTTMGDEWQMLLGDDYHIAEFRAEAGRFHFRVESFWLPASTREQALASLPLCQEVG